MRWQYATAFPNTYLDLWAKSEGWRARIEEKGKVRVEGWVLVPPLTKKGDHMHLTKANTRGDELVLKGEEGDAGWREMTLETCCQDLGEKLPSFSIKTIRQVAVPCNLPSFGQGCKLSKQHLVGSIGNQLEQTHTCWTNYFQTKHEQVETTSS